MINNINTYSNLFNTSSSASSTTSGIDEIIAENQQTARTTEQTGQDSANLYLSSRAQKIDTLSREFFTQGTLSFDDIDLLKERVYQLGLISKEDYSRLTETGFSDQDLATEDELPNQTLVSFIGEFLARIEETEASHDDNADVEIDEENITEESEIITLLKDALLTAKTILSDVEKAKIGPDFKESLANTLMLLKDTINADSFAEISLDDRVGFTKIYQALDIVDKISPQRLNNEKLNRYIEIGTI
jgi:hypothetical protein